MNTGEADRGAPVFLGPRLREDDSLAQVRRACESRRRAAAGVVTTPANRAVVSAMEAIRIPAQRPAGTARERKLKRCGYGTIAGIDEVGRGPLAGPVVAAAVVLDLKRVPKGLADSKVLSCEQREALFEKIVATAEVGIASISHLEIDVINIRQASLTAMCRALAALPCRPDVALVDGNDPPA